MDSLKQVLADPRSDLEDDRWLWEHLLMWAWDGFESDGLFGALKGLRCGGARLVVESDKARLMPGTWDALEYAALRNKYLMPHAAKLQRLLSDLGPWAIKQMAEWEAKR